MEKIYLTVNVLIILLNIIMPRSRRQFCQIKFNFIKFNVYAQTPLLRFVVDLLYNWFPWLLCIGLLKPYSLIFFTNHGNQENPNYCTN